MRTMLLSFKAGVYQKVITGEKIYEHRKVFPDEPIKAYLYVSTPIKAVVGIMYLNNKTDIESWKEKYSYDEKAVERITNYLQHHKYAMEIVEFQDTNKIPLEQLRTDLPGFVVPQMYYFIDDTPLLEYLEQKLEPCGAKIVHDFSNVTSEQICKE
jgi:predicted transcriptional regulator